MHTGIEQFQRHPLILLIATQFLFYPLAVTAKSICNPLSTYTCGLPYPSNYIAEASENSATGIQLSIDDAIFPEHTLDEYPALAYPSAILNGLNGFSALTPVLFELPDVIDLESLPINGGNALLVFDMETGARLSVRADVSMPAMREGIAVPSMVVEGFPRSRWPFGHTLVAVLTNSIKNLDGNEFITPDVIKAAIANDDSELASSSEPVVSFIESQGIDRNDILSFTQFSIRDEASVTQPLLNLADIVAQEDHKIEITGKVFMPTGDIAAIVTGRVRSLDFRDAEDGHIDFFQPEYRENWVTFTLNLPRAALTKSVPIVIYGHGLGVNKETAVLSVRNNASRGVATIAIDQPYHGMRIVDDGAYFLNLFHPKDVMKVTGTVGQSTLDFHSLLHGLKSELKDLDILPGGSLLFSLNGAFRGGRGKPDIDIDEVYYMGTSLGALFGTSFAATAPGVKGAYLEAAGAGVANTLNHTTLYEVLKFFEVVPANLTGADAVLFASIMLHDVDYADGLNFAHFFRNPPPPLVPRPLAVQYGIDDQVVYDGSAIALAQVAGLSLVRPSFDAWEYLDEIPHFDMGYGVVQAQSNINEVFIDNPNIATDLWSHLTFIKDRSAAGLDEWIDQVIFHKNLRPVESFSDEESPDEDEEESDPVPETTEPEPEEPVVEVPTPSCEPNCVVQPSTEPVTPAPTPSTDNTTNNSTNTSASPSAAASSTTAKVVSSSGGGGIDQFVILMLISFMTVRQRTKSAKK